MSSSVLVCIHTNVHNYSCDVQVALVWFIIDAFTHLSLELSYVLLALGPTAEKSDSMFAFVWREYARADKRYAHSRLVGSRWPGRKCLIDI